MSECTSSKFCILFWLCRVKSFRQKESVSFQYCILFHLKCVVDSINSLWYDNYQSSHKFLGATRLLETKLLLQILNFVFLTVLKCSRLIRQTLKFLPNITTDNFTSNADDWSKFWETSERRPIWKYFTDWNLKKIENLGKWEYLTQSWALIFNRAI